MMAQSEHASAAPPEQTPLAARGNPWRIASNAGLFLLLTQLLLLASARIVSNALGDVGYGRFGLAMVFSIYAYQFAQWGLDPLLTRLLVRAKSEQAGAHLASFLRQRQLAAVVVLLVGIGVAASWSVADERQLVYLGLVDGLALALSIPAAFDARGRITLYFGLIAVRQISYLILLILLVSLWPTSVTPLLVLMVHAACILLQVSLEWVWVRRTYGALHWSGALAGAWSLCRLALPLALAAGALQVLCVLGPPSLVATGLEVELGFLVVSNQLVTALSGFMSVPARITHARLSALSPISRNFRRAVWLTAATLAAGGILISGLLSLFAPQVVWLLFGQQFLPAAPIFQVDAWRAVGVLASAVLGSALICQQRLRIYAGCHILALLVGVSIAILFVPTYGAIAAVGAVAVGRAAFAVFAGLAFLMPYNAARPQPKGVVDGETGCAFVVNGYVNSVDGFAVETMNNATDVLLVLPVLASAGAERIVAELARRLPQHGFTPSVLCLEDERAAVGEELAAAGVPVVGLRLSRRRSLACAGAILRRLPVRRPLIIHSHLFHANFATRLAYAWLSKADRAGVRVVSTVHVAEQRFRPWQFALDRITARYASKEVCVSHAVACFQQKRTGLPVSFFHVIENGIDLERFGLILRQSDITTACVVSVGRLDPQKDFPTLLRAWKLVADQRPDLRLKIAGDGPDASNLKALAKKLSLRNVEFLGFVADVPALLHKANLYVQSSAWEGSPLTVAEAMACALPVIVTDADSLPELVAHNRTGLVVPKGRPEKLAQAILELSTNNEKAAALGQAARVEALRRFSVDRMVADYARLYRELIGDRR
ncbi:MAG: glycosyltransferase [Planctomycetota bacterium]